MNDNEFNLQRDAKSILQAHTPQRRLIKTD